GCAQELVPEAWPNEAHDNAAPEGRPNLAQRFSAGKSAPNDSSPGGTTEFLRAISGALADSLWGELQSGAADFGDANDANALHGRFHRPNQREDQLVQSNQTETQRGRAREREPLAHLVE